LQQKINSNSFEFDFDQKFLVLRRPIPFIRNDARNRRRNSRIPRGSPRLRALVQNLFSLPLHLLMIPQLIPNHKKLKTERRLQIDPPVRGRLGKWLACESIRKSKK